jgi:MoaA/NifB/PqqE/SkfB family radical SAM enzyme
MKCALTFITKACPRNCEYCDIASSTFSNEELEVGQWIDAFKILKEIGVTFNLILGNESWLLGDRLIQIMEHNKVPYAMYTTAPEKLFDKYHEKFFTGPIDNLSCGVDYPLSYLLMRESSLGVTMNDMEKKSLDGWLALLKTRFKYPYVDTQGMVTIHRQNYRMLPLLVNELTRFGIFIGMNFIHYNKDGEFDFFPSKDDLKDFLFTTTKHLLSIESVLKQALSSTHLIQQPEVFEVKKHSLRYLTNMEWHCAGDPYGGPTIQSDGTLRCCGYRPGKQSPRFSIFDLTNKSAIEEWKWAVKTDAMNCPGCSWSYPRMYHYWMGRDPKFGEQIFTKHAGKHIPKDKWSERKVE